MNFDVPLMAVLQRSNPVPDPEQLADSDEAKELALRRPGSVLDWQIEDDDYVGDGYRISLLAPSNWEITHQDRHLAYDQSRRSAFAVVERHRREALRRFDLIKWAEVMVGALLVWLVANQLIAPGIAWWLLAFVLLFVGISTLVRFGAALSRSVVDEYRRPLPWERRG